MEGIRALRTEGWEREKERGETERDGCKEGCTGGRERAESSL